MNALAKDPAPSQKPIVLYVDDDAGNRQAFRAAFRHQMEVLLAENLREAWQVLNARDVHVVICDQRMPGTTGSELLAMVKERFPKARRMLVTAYADLDAIIDAVNNGGVTKYFAKPWVNDQLVKAVNDAVAEIEAEARQAEYTERLLEANKQLEFALRQRLIS